MLKGDAFGSGAMRDEGGLTTVRCSRVDPLLYCEATVEWECCRCILTQVMGFIKKGHMMAEHDKVAA